MVVCQPERDLCIINYCETQLFFCTRLIEGRKKTFTHHYCCYYYCCYHLPRSMKHGDGPLLFSGVDGGELPFARKQEEKKLQVVRLGLTVRSPKVRT
jgi:hypothetical protein